MVTRAARPSLRALLTLTCVVGAACTPEGEGTLPPSTTPTPTAAPPTATPTATRAPTQSDAESPTAPHTEGEDRTPTPTATAEPTSTEAEPTVGNKVYGLSPRELLIRASLDLRGIRPTEAEYAAVEADPSAAVTLAQGFLDDARFGARVRALFSPVFRTQLDTFPVPAMDYGIEDAAGFYASVGDEALQIVSYLATQDRPYTEIVTGDYTLANELLAEAWPLDYPEGETGWRVSHYTDNRPAAGVLSTNSLWWRYPSDGVNYNRGRANALSRILLCNNYAARPVTFDTSIDLTDSALVNDALKTNPSCINCHSSLDPLASYVFGFQYVAKGDPVDASPYHPERERMWQTTTGTAPGYYGAPGYTLRDLGHQIAADPRLPACVVQEVYEGLLDRPSTVDDTDPLNSHRNAFIRSGLRLKPLFASIIADPRYATSEGTADGRIALKVASPELLASQIEDLTGYRLTSGGYDLLLLDERGLRSLAGGLDGLTGAAPAKGATPTLALVTQRVAEGAAWYVATSDAAAAPEARRLFAGVDFTETPATNRDAMAAQVMALHRRLYGTRVEADGPEVEAALSLWTDLYAARPSAVEAWAGVLSALLRDPAFLFY